MRATTLEDIGCRACLHIDRHLIDDINRVRDVINIEIRVSDMELFEKLLSHGSKPIIIKILIDQSNILSTARPGFRKK